MDKRIADAEKKVSNFYFLAKNNLTRAAKKWLNVKKLNVNKQVKNIGNKESVEAKNLNVQLECLKALKPLALADSALLRLQIFEIGASDTKSKTPVSIEDNKCEKDIIKKWFNSQLFQTESKQLIETRRKRNRELRHLKERLGRKERRKDFAEIKKTRKSKALPSQQEMFLEASTASLNNNQQKKKPHRKNRLGQRERKRRAEAKEREEGIFNRELKPNRKERRELEKRGLLKPKKKKPNELQESAKSKQVNETKELSEHHPSWDAKRKKELAEKKAKFSGKKMTFDDESDGGYASSDSD
jgi:hypothetical protein